MNANINRPADIRHRNWTGQLEALIGEGLLLAGCHHRQLAPKVEIRLVSISAEAYDSTSHIRSRPPDLA